jgi:hypothetical protein
VNGLPWGARPPASIPPSGASGGRAYSNKVAPAEPATAPSTAAATV